MAYSELIKNFDTIRDYMREFYVYGFKRRMDYAGKSPRSYDNERRRIESWLGEAMCFRNEAEGKTLFLSIDSRQILQNPLYKAFRAKSFTSGAITLHFYLLDLLKAAQAANSAQAQSSTQTWTAKYTANQPIALSIKDIMNILENDYLSFFENAPLFDESTLRKKLKEYENLGLVVSEKQGKQLLYRLSESSINLSEWETALLFFSEADPLGVVGSYLLDRLSEIKFRTMSPSPCLSNTLPSVAIDTKGAAQALPYFGFKHHYILHALESEVLYALFEAISEKNSVDLSIFSSKRGGKVAVRKVQPLKIYMSTQTGRGYLMAYIYEFKRIILYRLDSIRGVKPGTQEPKFSDFLDMGEAYGKHLWGTSAGSMKQSGLDKVEMILKIGPEEGFIAERLEREKRGGRVENLGEGKYAFTIEVYDGGEFLPWVRTFIGRILSFTCSNSHVTETFYEDLKAMEKMYGGV